MTVISPNMAKSSDIRGKNQKDVKILVMGDIHIGHHRTQTPELVAKLHGVFCEKKSIKELDFIFLNGDVFDRLLYRNDPHSHLIDKLVHSILTLCSKYKIALRVLEGTPSHDMKQSKVFVDMAENLNIELDLRYVSDLEIEMHEKTGMSIMYLPDEWHIDLKMCYVEAVKRLGLAGLDKVDVIMMHGAFDYQYPPHVPVETHDSAQWQTLAELAIYISHVHQHSQHGIIVAPGSFDRLSHGDESAKGYVISTLTSTTVEHEFMQNKRAKTYKDIPCHGVDVEEALALIESEVKAVEKGSYLRIVCNYDDNIAKAKDYLRSCYPNVFWEVKVVGSADTSGQVTTLLTEETFQAVALTKDSLPRILQERFALRMASSEVSNRAMQLLREHL